MKTTRARALVLCLPVLLWGGTALAVEIFLNGVKITGLSDQRIEKATVTLDKAGNVHISAPEYKVREVGGEAAPAAVAPAPAVSKSNLGRQYFVITDAPRTNLSGYEVQLMVNSRFVRTFDDSIPQTIIELNEHLQAGANTVSFLGKRPAGKAVGAGADVFTILVGYGKTDGGQLVIEEVVGELKIPASAQGEVAKSFDFTAK
ncbi:MAG TPA: hypothetical protein PK668_00260 [Myxococcota bacterium]|nr:hypothetical protein [Myxococcota bacterium]HRY95735.1 hypothetical protein [Myxococcota bacterium]HSA22579.1 hypothetical protein [Myxococcota bacterium]